MTALAWRSARSHAASLAGAFVALAAGAALLSALILTLASAAGAAASPAWFTTPDVVVAGTDTVSVTSGAGSDRQTSTVITSQARSVPNGLARQLSRLGAVTVIDFAGYAYLPGAPGTTVHPWSAAALHRFGWAEGRPPAAGQIVLTAPTGYRPGDRVSVQTAAGPRLFVVSGVIRTAAAPALYSADAVAAAAAGGRISAVALTARDGVPPAALAVRARALARRQPVRVLVGAHRQDALPSPDAAVLEGTLSLLGITLGVAGFVSVMVIAGTFGYTVAARRRELGLLRAAGATPRQARRLILGEALAVSPAEALREAELDRGVMTPLRWAGGLAALAGAAPVIWVSATIHSADASAVFLAVAALLITGCWMLAPALVRPLVWLLGMPLAVGRGGAGMLPGAARTPRSGGPPPPPPRSWSRSAWPARRWPAPTP